MQRFTERIYERMCGHPMEEVLPEAIRDRIPDEFSYNLICGKLSSVLYDAIYNISERLGTDVDEDLDICKIRDCYKRITRHLAEKMYYYGKMDLERLDYSEEELKQIYAQLNPYWREEFDSDHTTNITPEQLDYESIFGNYT